MAFLVTRERLAGYSDAVGAAGRGWGATPVAIVERNRRGQGHAAMQDLLQQVPAGATPVVLTMSDELALGARVALSEVDRTAVITTGWAGSSEALSTGITTVANPLREQGRLCTRTAFRPDTPSNPVGWRIVNAEQLP